MHKLILTNGPDLNPAWVNRIAVTKDYVGKGALTLVSALAAGGSLLVGTEYFYKVVALIRKGLTISGDAANQLSSLTLTGPTSTRLYWKLTATGIVRTFTLSRDPKWLQVVASGFRNNDGVITLLEKNGSGITGAVTVAYTADDGGTDNFITTEHTFYAGNEETSETIVVGTQTVNLSWALPGGEVDGYRIYRGTATGVYDGFFLTTGVTFSDTGAVYLSADEAWFKDNIRHVSGHFLPAGDPGGLPHFQKCTLFIPFTTGPSIEIDLTTVSNHPTWATGLLPSVYVAQNEFNEWL